MNDSLWIDTADGGIINITHFCMIRIFEEDDSWIDKSEHEPDPQSDGYYVSALLPVAPYRFNAASDKTDALAGFKLFVGTWQACLEFESYLKTTLLSVRFVDIPNDADEMETLEINTTNDEMEIFEINTTNKKLLAEDLTG